MNVYTEFEGNDRMADEEIPENVDLRFLATQVGKVLDGQREMHGQIGELQIAVAATRADLSIVKDDVNVLKEDVNALKEDVNALKEDVNALKESVHIIEHDIGGIKMRVERIERHTGLVKT